VGQKYNGKKDKRLIAESLLIQITGVDTAKKIITENMFSKGGTITNKYFDALLEALEKYKNIERDGYTYPVSEIDQSELELAVNDFPEGSFEGRKLLVSHFRYERDKRLSLCAKRLARNKHPEKFLVCEICNAIPEKKYGLDLIEAHHRVPLSKLKKSSKIIPSDFAMLCPDCHRAVHKVENCSMKDISDRLNRFSLFK